MAYDSSSMLGSQQFAGAVVTARGSGPRHAARVHGTGLAGSGAKGVHGPLVEVLGRMPRSEVTSAAVSRGLPRSNLTITFADGGS